MKQVSRFLILFIKKHPVSCLTALSAILLFSALLLYGVTYTPDSYTYKQAWYVISGGNVDIMRTPSYPIFIGIVQNLFGQYFDFGVGFIQSLVFLFTIKYFWRIAIRLTNNKKTSFIVTLLFITLPGISSYSLCLLTELFSICGLIVTIYLLVKLYDSPRQKYFWGLFPLVLFLIFLRPALLYIIIALAILAVYWFFTKQNKQAIYISIPIIISLAALYGYNKAIESKTGVFTISTISAKNDYTILFTEPGITDNVKIENPEISQVIEENNNEGIEEREYNRKLDNIPFKQSYETLQCIKKQIGLKWYLRSYLRFCSSAKYTGLENYALSIHLLSLLEQFIPIRLSVYYFIILVYIFVLIALYHLKRKINWLSWLMVLMCCGQIAVMSIGSYSEWARLFVPCTPLVMLITAHLLSAIKINELNCDPIPK